MIEKKKEMATSPPLYDEKYNQGYIKMLDEVS
jgi:hypothetical protein